MASGTARAHPNGMREQYDPPNRYAWIVYAAGMVIFGGLAGYIIAVETSPTAAAVRAASSPVAAAPAVPAVDESQLRAYREILARDPRNTQAAVSAGNLLYDSQRYQEAIGFYEQAIALNPSDINVSTDLGTALWYAGRPDDALVRFDKSLALNPTHPQTLFNVGIVRADGKHDYPGAIAAWEKLLQTNPGYPDAAHVRSLISDAQTKTSAP
jgi:cytochrome c-type biogenesis protein CcmH/NrfG